MRVLQERQIVIAKRPRTSALGRRLERHHHVHGRLQLLQPADGTAKGLQQRRGASVVCHEGSRERRHQIHVRSVWPGLRREHTLMLQEVAANALVLSRRRCVRRVGCHGEHSQVAV